MQTDEPGQANGEPADGLLEGRFEGRETFRERVRQLLARAAEEAWPEIIVCDTDFADWPLGERAVRESLDAWARTGHRWTMLAQRYDEVARLHPRFADWRRTFGHKIECRGCGGSDAADLPSVLWSPRWYLHRLDPIHSRGLCGTQPTTRVALRERLDAALVKSHSAFPATTLGL